MKNPTVHIRFILSCLSAFSMISLSGAADEKIITIGVSGTYSGGFAAVGKNVGDGMTDYFSYLVNQGGIAYKDPVSGKNEKMPIRIHIEDNHYNMNRAVTAYRELRAKGANVIIGFGSTPGEICASLASQDRFPYLAWYSYASPIAYWPRPQYYWSFLPAVSESATPIIKWFVTQKWQGKGKPKIGILAADLPSWRVLGKPGLMDGYIRSQGGESAGIEFVPLETGDMIAPIAKLLFHQKADCLVFIGASSQTPVLVKDMKRLGTDPEKITVICSLSAWDESLFSSVPQEIEGIYGEVHAVSPDTDTPGIRMVKTAAKAAGRDPEKIVMNYINGFMGAFVLETAIRRALEKHGYETVVRSGSAIRDELHSFGSADPMGLAPAIEVRHTEQPYFINYCLVKIKLTHYNFSI
ncbi:MAG: ABC transporter substrate-binding protein [Desulfococcaceae bacterium]